MIKNQPQELGRMLNKKGIGFWGWLLLEWSNKSYIKARKTNFQMFLCYSNVQKPYKLLNAFQRLDIPSLTILCVYECLSCLTEVFPFNCDYLSLVREKG